MAKTEIPGYMTLEEAQAAIDLLIERGDILKLLYLNQVRQNPGLAETPEYQRRFNGFYRMRQQPPAFYDCFYAMLRHYAAAGEAPPLGQILQELWEGVHRHYLSFGSKMRATLTDQAVIFDSLLAHHFGVLANQVLHDPTWLETLLHRYA